MFSCLQQKPKQTTKYAITFVHVCTNTIHKLNNIIITNNALQTQKIDTIVIIAEHSGMKQKIILPQNWLKYFIFNFIMPYDHKSYSHTHTVKIDTDI
jgi:hypothetical protein